MAALELIEQLEEWGTFDASVIAKLRDKVAQAPTEPTAEAVLNYLVKKKIITRQQGEELLDRYLNDPGQDSAVLLQTDLLASDQPMAPSGSDPDELEPLDELDDPVDVDQTVLDQGQYASDAPLATGNAPPGYENQGMYDPNQGYPQQGNMAEAAAGWSEEQAAAGGAGGGHSAFSGKIVKGNPWEGMWLWIGAGLLVLFGAVAIGLSYFLTRLSAEELWAKAESAQTNFNFSEAKLRYTEFAERFTTDDKASEARVQAAMCDIHIPFRSNDYTKALDNAEEILPVLLDEQSFNVARDDLADILPKVGLGLAKSAKRQSDITAKRDEYAKALRAQALVANTSYITSKKRGSNLVAGKIAELNEEIATVDRQLSQEETKDSVLGQIRMLVDDSKTSDAFQKYRELTRDFPSLESRQEVREVRNLIADREKGLVQSGAAESGVAEPAAQPTTIAIANRFGSAVSVSDRGVIPVLVEGALYALQGRDGQLLWRRFLGFETDYLPQLFPDETKVEWLVAQGKDHSLLRVDAATGQVLWKHVIGERFTEPVVTRDFVFFSTFSGRVVKLDSASGEGVQQAQLPQTVTSPLALGGNDSLIYQVGDHWYMYVLDVQNLECREVFLLNHDKGSVVTAPVFQLGLLYIAESRSQNSKVHVLRAEERGWNFERPQPEINFAGRLEIPMMPYGRDDVIVVDDRGNVSVLSAIGEENDRPVQESVRMSFDPSENVVTRAMIARGGDFYVNGLGLYRFQLRKQMQDFEQQASSNPTDAYLAKPIMVEDTLVYVRRRSGSAIITVTAANRDTLAPQWEVDLGAPLAGTPFVAGSQAYAINSQGDQFQLAVDGETKNLGLALKRGSTTRQPLQFSSLLVNEQGLGMVAGPPTVKSFMIFDQLAAEENNRSRVKPWDNKVLPLSGDPVRMRDFAVACSTTGAVFLVDFKTGILSPTAFQPALAPGVEVEWLNPTVLDDQTVFVALAQGGVYRLEIAGGGLAKLAEGLLESSQLVGRTAQLGGKPIVVARRRNETAQVDSLVVLADDMSEANSVELPSRVHNGPWQSGDQLLVETVDGQWLMLDQSLQITGQVAAGDRGTIAGTPVFDGQWHLVTNQGHVVSLNGGEVAADVDLQQPLSNGPVQISGKWLATTPDGSILYAE